MCDESTVATTEALLAHTDQKVWKWTKKRFLPRQILQYVSLVKNLGKKLCEKPCKVLLLDRWWSSWWQYSSLSVHFWWQILWHSKNKPDCTFALNTLLFDSPKDFGAIFTPGLKSQAKLRTGFMKEASRQTCRSRPCCSGSMFEGNVKTLTTIGGIGLTLCCFLTSTFIAVGPTMVSRCFLFDW